MKNNRKTLPIVATVLAFCISKFLLAKVGNPIIHIVISAVIGGLCGAGIALIEAFLTGRMNTKALTWAFALTLFSVISNLFFLPINPGVTGRAGAIIYAIFFVVGLSVLGTITYWVVAKLFLGWKSSDEIPREINRRQETYLKITATSFTVFLVIYLFQVLSGRSSAKPLNDQFVDSRQLDTAATASEKSLAEKRADQDSNQYLAKKHNWRTIQDWDKERHLRDTEQFEKDCAGGDYDACYSFSHDLRLKGNRAKISNVFEALCKDGKATGCYYLGREAHNDGRFKDALALYKKACAIDEYACYELAKIERARENYDAWVNLCEKSCKARNPVACNELAEIYKSMALIDANYSKNCVAVTPIREKVEQCRIMSAMKQLATKYENLNSLASEALLNECKLGSLGACEDLDHKFIAEGRKDPDLLSVFDIANEINLERCRRGVVTGTDESLSLRSTCEYVMPRTTADRLKIHSFFCDKGCPWNCSGKASIEREIGQIKKSNLTLEKDAQEAKFLCAENNLGACDRMVIDLGIFNRCIKNAAGFRPSIQTCYSSYKNPLGRARRELIRYKTILQRLCREGDEEVCLDLKTPEKQSIYESIPEN